MSIFDNSGNTPHRTPARGQPPARGHGRRTYGTSANTYLVGRRASRSSPHRRSRTVPIERTGDPVQEQATYGASREFRAFNLANHPQPTPRAGLQNEPPARPASPSQPENGPQRARCSNQILSAFMKQRTYLITLPDRPRIRGTRAGRNVTSSVRRRFAQGGLSSLTSLSSHMLYAAQPRPTVLRPDTLRTIYHGLCRTMEPSKPVFALAFCADQYMELPLLVAATSAVKHVSTHFDVRVYLMLSSVGEKGIARIRKAL